MLSRRHPTLKRIRALRRDGPLRRSEGVFVAEGLHLVEEALATRASIELAVVAPRLRAREPGRRLAQRLADRDVQLVETDDATLDSLQDARSPQPVMAVVRRPSPSFDDCLDTGSAPPLLLVAHALQDPGNLGNLLRTADAAGAHAVLVSGDSVDLFHPRTVRASMGSIFRVRALAVDLDALVGRLDGLQISKVGTDPSAGTSLHDTDLRGAVALFFGREGQGLDAEVRDRLDTTLRIPMRRGVESLSVGAAAAIVLYEAARQRGSFG